MGFVVTDILQYLTTTAVKPLWQAHPIILYANDDNRIFWLQPW